MFRQKSALPQSPLPLSQGSQPEVAELETGQLPTRWTVQGSKDSVAVLVSLVAISGTMRLVNKDL